MAKSRRPSYVPENKHWSEQGRDGRGRFKKPKFPRGRKVMQRGILGPRIEKAPAMRASLPLVLRDIRMKSRYSVEQVAQLTGLAMKTIRKYESGAAFNDEGGPGILRVEKIIRACGGRLIVEYDRRNPSAVYHPSLAFRSEPAGRDLDTSGRAD